MLDRAGDALPLQGHAERLRVGVERQLQAARDAQKEFFVAAQLLGEVGVRGAQTEKALRLRLVQQEKKLRGRLHEMHVELSGEQGAVCERLKEGEKTAVEIDEALCELERRAERLQQRVGVSLSID